MSKRKKKNFEIRFYEKLIEEKPNFIQALTCLGDLYTRYGFYEEGLSVDMRLAKLKPDDPIVHYNLACSFSLVGDIDNGLKTLKRAILLGYDDLDYILDDPDLSNLRKDPRFKEFFKKVRANLYLDKTDNQKLKIE
ncbi:MAG: hypothetical protein NC820_01420 [Candidatus Omnitrophica bacterium]|nr:hypothetical protein [Candidatus Omnitrophota bacterium]